MTLELNPLFKLPEKAIIIMTYLDEVGPKTQNELFADLGFTHRVLRYTLRRMLKRGVIYKQANFEDMRSHYYVINDQVVGNNVQLFLKTEGYPCEV